MSTPITVEQLLELVERASQSYSVITSSSDTPEWLRTDETIHYLDARDLRDGLQAILDARPQAVFAEMVGMEAREAVEFIKNRSPYLKEKHPVVNIIPIREQYHNPERQASQYANQPGSLVLCVNDDGKILSIIGIS